MRRPPAEYHAITRWMDGGWQIIDGWYADRNAAAELATDLARDYRITTSVITVLDPWPLPAWRPPGGAV